MTTSTGTLKVDMQPCWLLTAFTSGFITKPNHNWYARLYVTATAVIAKLTIQPAPARMLISVAYFEICKVKTLSAHPVSQHHDQDDFVLKMKKNPVAS